MEQGTENPAAIQLVGQFQACEDEILTSASFTPEDAMHLGGTYIWLLGNLARMEYGQLSPAQRVI